MFWHLTSKKKPKELKEEGERIYNFVLVRILAYGHEGFMVARWNPRKEEWLPIGSNEAIGKGKWEHTIVTHWQEITFLNQQVMGEIYV